MSYVPSRIAAVESNSADLLPQVPVMRENHLYVMSLEEYEPNPEFVGRNFNAGEVVQLVLKSRSSGRWLPFEYVQMVMMHE
jgi:DNA-dependent metalloprotease WSS1